MGEPAQEKKQVIDAKAQAKFAKSQGKKNGVGKIYYDPFGDRVLEIAVVNGEYVLTNRIKNFVSLQNLISILFNTD